MVSIRIYKTKDDLVMVLLNKKSKLIMKQHYSYTANEMGDKPVTIISKKKNVKAYLLVAICIGILILIFI